MNPYYCVLLGLRVDLVRVDLVSGWLVVMHTYLNNFPLSLHGTQLKTVTQRSLHVLNNKL